MCILQVRMTYGWQPKRRTERRNFLPKWSIPDHCKMNPWKNLYRFVERCRYKLVYFVRKILKLQGFLTRLGSEQIGRVLKLRFILDLKFVLFLLLNHPVLEYSKDFGTIPKQNHWRCWFSISPTFFGELSRCQSTAMWSVFFSSRTGDFVGHLMFDLDFQIQKKGDCMVTSQFTGKLVLGY